MNSNSQPRPDPVLFPAASTRMPVLRIEASGLSLLDDDNRNEALQSILFTAREPGIAAHQTNFDATRAQRLYYRNLLFDLRRQMAAGLRLSITALESPGVAPIRFPVISVAIHASCSAAGMKKQQRPSSNPF
jgi:hypothetical protein